MLGTDTDAHKPMMHDAVVYQKYCHTLQRRGLALTSYIEGIIILVLLSCSSISISYNHECEGCIQFKAPD